MFIASDIFALAGGYLLGSIPTGYLAGKICGIDVRKVGSGNIGATNVFRILGKRAGALVLAIDCLKGYLAATLIARLGLEVTGATATVIMQERAAIIAGIAAVLGHNYTIWLKFKGGKGIATSAGVVLAWVPWGLLISLAAWLIALAATRYVSVASVVAALCLPFAVWLTGSSWRMIGICSVLSILAIYKHRSNLRRLWNGTEHRLGTKHSSSQPQSAR